MDFTGGKALGPIQCDQRPSAQAPEWIEYAVDRDCFEEQRIEYTRRRAVQHFPDMRIRWNGGDAEQGLAIRPPVSLFQTALMTQEGRASHEKHRESRKADVGHGVLAVAVRPSALIRETGADGIQFGDQGLQGSHRAIESKIVPRRQAKSSYTVTRTEECRGLLHIRLTRRGVAGS